MFGTLGCGSDAVERGAGGGTGLSSEAIDVPVYEWDPTWPQPLPDTWVVGPVVGVSVDAMDHIWVVHRPRGAVSGWQDQCCVPAPAVIEFGQEGNVVQAWGGPRGEDLARPTVLTWSPPTDYEWVQSEHNIFVDHRDNVWLGNYGGSHILKMSRDGELLLQIGRPKAQGQDSNDTGAFGSPTGITVDPATNEVYVADGYGNRRVIVFDADTGAYKRHWGAYGNTPDDSVSVTYTATGPPSQQFNTAHCVQIDQDDLVWVCDRANFRIQVFQKDGTFVKEVVIAPPPEGTTPLVIARVKRWQRRDEVDAHWIGVRPCVLSRPGSALCVRGGRRQRESVDPATQRSGDPRLDRPGGTLGRRFLDGAQPRGRLRQQPVHQRKRRRPPRPEILVPRDACGVWKRLIPPGRDFGRRATAVTGPRSPAPVRFSRQRH